MEKFEELSARTKALAVRMRKEEQYFIKSADARCNSVAVQELLDAAMAFDCSLHEMEGVRLTDFAVRLVDGFLQNQKMANTPISSGRNTDEARPKKRRKATTGRNPGSSEPRE